MFFFRTKWHIPPCASGSLSLNEMMILTLEVTERITCVSPCEYSAQSLAESEHCISLLSRVLYGTCLKEGALVAKVQAPWRQTIAYVVKGR